MSGKVVRKIAFCGLLSLLVVSTPMYGMEPLQRQEEYTPLEQDSQEAELLGRMARAPRVADRLAPILAQDQDGRMLWGNIAAVVGFALVVSYAFVGV